MEIIIPADDAAGATESAGRYQALLSDGSPVWDGPCATDCILIGKAYHDIYGFTVEIVDTAHPEWFDMRGGA